MSRRTNGDIEYKVINEKVTLACLNDPDDVMDEVHNQCCLTTCDLVKAIDIFADTINLEIPNYFQGKAICQDGDEFSENDGKKLARNKAIFKYHEVMRKKYDQILRMMEYAYPEISKLYEEHSNAAGKMFLEHKNYCENKSFK